MSYGVKIIIFAVLSALISAGMGLHQHMVVVQNNRLEEDLKTNLDLVDRFFLSKMKMEQLMAPSLKAFMDFEVETAEKTEWALQKDFMDSLGVLRELTRKAGLSASVPILEEVQQRCVRDMRNKKAYYFKLNQFAEATEGTDQWRLGHKVNEQLVFMLKENSQTQTLFAKAMKLAIEQSGRSAMDINHQTKTLRLGVGAAGLFSAGLLVYGLLLQRKLRSSMQFLVNAISRVAAGDLTVRF